MLDKKLLNSVNTKIKVCIGLSITILISTCVLLYQIIG